MESESFNFMRELFQLFLTLIAISVLAFITLYFLKRNLKARNRGQNRGAIIKVLERRALSQKSSLFVIEAFGKNFLISDSPSGIHLISELPSDVKAEEILEEMEKKQRSTLSLFPQKLKELLKNKNKV